MKQDEIIEMARQASFYVKDDEAYSPSNQEDFELTEHLGRFAKLVAQHEREAVLQTVEALYDSQDPNPMYQEGYNHALDHIEEFVKTRGKSERTL